MKLSTPRNAGHAGSGTSLPLNHNAPQIEMVPIGLLKDNPDEVRIYRDIDEKKAAAIFGKRAPDVPLIIDDENVVLVGGLVLRAARRLGLESLACIRVSNLTKVEYQRLSVAYSRLGELGSTDFEKLTELHLKFEVEIPGYETMDIGYEVAEIDFALAEVADGDPADKPIDNLSSDIAISKEGDLWLLDKHRMICGDSTNPAVLEMLTGTSHAALMFSDPPFGCVIDGFVASDGRHREFVMGSGDMGAEARSDR